MKKIHSHPIGIKKLAGFGRFSTKKTHMKKRKSPKPTKHYSTTFHKLCKLIPAGMVWTSLGFIALQFKADFMTTGSLPG